LAAILSSSLAVISSRLVLVSAFISVIRSAIMCSASVVWRCNDPVTSAQLFTQSDPF
jgi:hypothetical protein